MSGTHIVFGNSFGVPLAQVAQFHLLYTDPPYSEHVHTSATSQSKGRGTRKRELGFESLSRQARSHVAQWAAAVQRWSLIYSDVESSNYLAIAAQARGAEYVRTVPWVRWSMPQLSGDRPPQGFEHVLCLHRSDTSGRRPKPIRKHWNGPGNFTHLAEPAMRGETKHKCQKRLAQALRLVSFFSDPGERVFDPFTGSGTIPVACELLGRGCLGIELDETWAVKASARLAGAQNGRLSEQDRADVELFLASDDEPVANQTEGPSVARAQARARDRETLKKYLHTTR